jgi:small-conductance mechanosensitive channel
MTGKANRYERSLGERIQAEGIEVAGIGERLKLACLHFAGDTPLLLVNLLGLLLAFLVIGLGARPLYSAISAVLFVAAARLLFGLIHTLFLPARPRFRVVRCSNKVATYYRRWSYALLWTTIVAVPVPLFLYLFDVMPTTRAYLWQVYKTIMILIVVLFLLQKQRVIKVVGRPENLRARWLYTLVAAVYPLIVLGAVSLLILELIGYGALVSYLGWNTILTFAVLLGVTLVTSFLADIAWKLRQSAEEKRLAQQTEPESAQPPGGLSEAIVEPVDVMEDQEEPAERDYLVDLIASLAKWVARIAGLVLILQIWGITPVELKAAFTFPFIGRPIWRAFAAGAAIVVSVLLSRSLRSVLRKRVYPAYKATLDKGARAAVNTMLHYFLIALGAYVALQFLEIHMGAFAFLLGTLGLGLGLGLQPLFINFVSGLMIYFERHIKVGDVVEVGDKLGEVTAIRMRSTSIKTYDNIDIVIPNGEFITTQVTNWSLQDQRIRAHLDVGVAYGSDVDLVRDILLQIADEHPKVLKDPKPKVWFTDFGDSALMFKLLVWFADVTDRYTGMTDLRFALNRKFKEHGVTIPFPQRTLSTVGDEPLPVRFAEETGLAPSTLSDPSQAAQGSGI